MDTRRCLRCHKLLRADAQKCSLCGYVFLQTAARRSSKVTNGSRQPATASFPSNAPASPHRAGHYSGLHPEDQPYQSSFMPIMRPPAITRRLEEQESEDVLEPIAVSSAPLQETYEEEREQTPNRYVATPVPTLSPMPQRSTSVLSPMHTPLPLVEVEPLQPIPEPTLHEQITAPLPVQAHLTGKHQARGRITRVVFIAAILLFLVASSILMYLVVFAGTGKQVHTTATIPHSSSQQGQFTKPQLQLSATHIDFGTENTHYVLSLTNTGGQHVNWLAGVDSSWLSISPPYGTFNRQETATITVDRNNLATQVYTGNISFFQQGTNTPLRLKVTMSVNRLSATVTPSLTPIPTVGFTPVPAMAISTSTLTFNAIQGNNPAPQVFTLSNPGNATLNWAITGDANANSLLSVSPKGGNLSPGGSTLIAVTPNVGSSKAGVVNATLIIQDTDPGTTVKSQQVAVKIIISNQAFISVSTTSIACNLNSTTTSSTSQLRISNSGSATLNWAVLSQTLPSWISVDTTSGTLPSGFIAFVNIACNNPGLQTGTYTYTLVVSDTDAKTPVTPQNVLITLTVT
ncbi:MAG: BACON domain-containing protein [Ktedonobacteraceae bacterium]